MQFQLGLLLWKRFTEVIQLSCRWCRLLVVLGMFVCCVLSRSDPSCSKTDQARCFRDSPLLHASIDGIACDHAALCIVCKPSFQVFLPHEHLPLVLFVCVFCFLFNLLSTANTPHCPHPSPLDPLLQHTRTPCHPTACLLLASNAHSSGTIEIFAAPMLFIVTVQLTATSLVVEKSQRLREAMRMMGMREVR